MPRCERNFWIELDVDGKKTRVATGPRSKDGGFSMTIYMRDEGGAETAARIRGEVLWGGGELALNIAPDTSLQVTPPSPGGFIVRSKR